MSQRGKKHQKRSDGTACAGSQEGRKDQDNVPLGLAVGARQGAVLVENVTQASEPSLNPSAAVIGLRELWGSSRNKTYADTSPTERNRCSLQMRKKSICIFINSPILAPCYIKEETAPMTHLKSELEMFWLCYVKTNLFLPALFSALGN